MPDFDDEVTELEGDVKARQENQAKAFERLTKERDKLRERLAELEKSEAARKRAEAFQVMKIDTKYAELYTGEDSEDAIRDWATKFGFVTTDSSDVPDSTTTDALKTSQQTTLPSSGMQPVVGGAQPAERFLTDIAEVERLQRDNPAELQRLFQAGRVKLEKIDGGYRGTVPQPQ